MKLFIRWLLVCAVVIAASTVGIAMAGLRPLWAYLASATAVTFLIYGWDKWRAIRDKQRVPEATLHLLALAGGSAGALVGQVLFRHKTSKTRFRLVFLLVLMIQVAAVVAYFKYGPEVTRTLGEMF